MIISDQSPLKLIDEAMRNTNTKLIMRLVSGDDIESARRGAGLPSDAEADIPNLKLGEALLVTPDNPPTLIKIDPTGADKEERRAAQVDLKHANVAALQRAYAVQPKVLCRGLCKETGHISAQ